MRPVTLEWGEHRVVFTPVRKEKFSLKQVPLELRVNGNIVLSLEHMTGEDERYSVNLNMGDAFSCSMGKFRKEENARKCYETCLKALKEGGRISVPVSSGVRIHDAQGRTLEQSYDQEPSIFEEDYAPRYMSSPAQTG